MPKFYVIALLVVGLSSIACVELYIGPWEPEPPVVRVGESCERDTDCGDEEFCDSMCVEQGEGRFCEHFERQCASSKKQETASDL